MSASPPDLLDRAARPIDTLRVSAALATPWCWPRDHRHAARARALGLTAPEPPGPGSALLVAITADHQPSALLRLDPTGQGALPIRGEALTALRRCERLVTRDLPLLIGARELGAAPRWGAALIWKEDERSPVESVDGPSYGGAFAVACASRLAGAPVPADLAVLAALDDRGALESVGGLQAKLALLSSSALGVRRVFVAEPQLEQARALAAGLPRALVVTGVKDLRGLLAAVFGDLGRAKASWERDPAQAAHLARGLFRVALDGSPLLAWGHVARTAARLCRALPDGAPERRLADFAKRVAWRHDHRIAPIEWPGAEELAALPLPLQQGWLAHVVQSRVDAATRDLPAILERARGRLPASLLDHHPADLRLRGAVGRGLARVRRYDEAAALLESCVRGWLDVFEEAEASYPLCELLRLEGLRRERKRLDCWLELVEWILGDPRADFMDRAYVRLNAGRALVLSGQPRDGLAWLVRDEFQLVRADAQLAAARWRARAHDALCRRGAAAEERRAVAAQAPGSEHDLVTRLDAALAVDGPVEAAYRRLRLKAPRRLRFLVEGLPARAAARRVADEGAW